MRYDAHNHLQDDWLAPHLPAIVEALAHAEVGGAVVNGTHPDDWARVAELAERFCWVRPSYGLHPWEVGRRPPDWQPLLEARLQAEPEAHVGEFGLDRWILDNARPNDARLAGRRRAPLEEQLEVFRWHIACATRHERAATIHCLQAWGALLEELRREPLPRRGFLLHAYGGSGELVPELVDLGAYFSFNPSFLDPRKQRAREAFRTIPVDRLLVETDAPAMPAPVDRTRHTLPDDPASGSRVAHPADLVVAYEGLAAIRGVSIDLLQEQVAQNWRRLFG